MPRAISDEQLLYMYAKPGKGYTDAELAEYFGVGRDAIFKRRKRFRDEHYIDFIETERGRYRIDNKTFLSNLRVSRAEALALYVAARRLSRSTRLSRKVVQSALDKLALALYQPMTEKLVKAAAQSPEHPNAARQESIVAELLRGWMEGIKVRIRYRGLKGTQNLTHIIEPYLIEPSPWSDSVYVIAYSNVLEKVSAFKLERIQRASLTTERYTVDADFSDETLFEYSWGIWNTDAEPQPVRLRFTDAIAIRRVQESIWHPHQTIEPQADGSLIWQAPVAEPKEMIPWIRGWGSAVTVLTPEWLREWIKRDVEKMTKLYGVTVKGKQLVAHVRDKDKKIQSLEEHLFAVSKYTGQFAGKIGLKEIGEILGLLHDVGKASAEFQKYIGSGTGLIAPNSADWVDVRTLKGKIDHSTAGAQIIYQKLSERGDKAMVTAMAMALCIASHHSGLIDVLKPNGENNFQRRIERSEDDAHTNEAWKNLPDIAGKLDELLSNDIETQFIEKMNSLKIHPESYDTINFKIGLLVRYLLSCLIDADRLDTADFEFPFNKHIRNYSNYIPWETLIEKLNRKLDEFEDQLNRNDVDELRSRVSKACFDFAAKQKGVYQLTVPTGGGKTLASLRFALNHAKKHGMDRIFYIVPYTSIIDQNADEVRKILEETDKNGQYLNKVVLEHHSNIITNDEDEEKNWIAAKRRNLLSENWDAPIVFTTQVQFLEALFGSGTKSVRRMHQLANAVIIFDEVQTIPVRTVQMFNAALEFLVHGCGSTVVLCTATQPLLDKVEPPQHALKVDGKIIENEKDLFEQLRRVEVFDERKIGSGWTDEETAELATQELDAKGSVLIIVNTKKSALSLYKTLVASNSKEIIYHLSTNMCPAHRLEKLDEIRIKLNNGEPIICVSTQLIEAGVDVDFGSVIRYIAGLDSITQAAGRCNRSGKQKDENGNKVLGNVFIVNPVNENTDILKDIQEGTKVAERILDEFDNNPKSFDNDRLGLNAMKRYYNYYFYRRKGEMAYNIGPNSLAKREDNLFNLLSRNTIAAQRDTSSMGRKVTFFFKQAFQTAAREFRVIDSHTYGVIVPYGEEGQEIINKLCSTNELEKQYKLIKKAQRYSVNLFQHEFKKLAGLGAIKEVQEGSGIYYLNKQYYSDEFGWSKEIVNQMDTLIC